MQKIGELIRQLREKEGYPLRKVAAFLDIDQAVLSKMERGKRKLTKEQVIKLARFFNYDEKEMLITYLSDKILYEIEGEDLALEALKVAEQKIGYQKLTKPERNKIIRQIQNKLKQFSKVNKAWIFGSFSREDDSLESDIDIAIEAVEGFSYFDLAEIQYQLEKEIKRKIDIGFISSFKPYIYKHIKPELKFIFKNL